MSNLDHSFINERKFIVHPDSIPLTIEKIIDSKDISPCQQASCHGLTFNSPQTFQRNQKINIQINVDELKFSGNAKVIESIKTPKGYEISVEFLSSCDEFQVKMTLQVCQIKDFLKKKQDECKCENDSALKWINLNAASF